MAFNFPDAPAINDTVTIGSIVYEWNGVAWNIVQDKIYTTTATTAPANPIDGQLWFDETDGTLNVYFNDGTSSQWIVASGPPSASIAKGSAGDEIFWENEQTVTADYTITNGYNASSIGPITIASGVIVTIGAGETWRIL